MCGWALFKGQLNGFQLKKKIHCQHLKIRLHTQFQSSGFFGKLKNFENPRPGTSTIRWGRSKETEPSVVAQGRLVIPAGTLFRSQLPRQLFLAVPPQKPASP